MIRADWTPCFTSSAAWQRSCPLSFRVHPRTRARLEQRDPGSLDGIIALPPADYLEFIALEEAARLVITDSGGVQEETSALGVAYLSLPPYD